MNTDTFLLLLDDTTIKGYEHRVTCELPMPDTDLSGNSSSTAVSEEGFKPKKLSISLKICFDDHEDLSSLVQLAEAVNSTGERKIYTIVNKLAKAYNIRQVRFTESLRASELANSLAWQVNFSLLEYNSVPEKVESAQAENTSNTSNNNDDAIGQDTPSATEDNQELTEFEKLLAKADAYFTPDNDDETTT